MEKYKIMSNIALNISLATEYMFHVAYYMNETKEK